MQGQGAGDVFVYHCMARADIRIRVRPGVIRVRIGETAVRTVVRITAPVDHRSHSLLPTILTCQLSASVCFETLKKCIPDFFGVL